MIFGAVPIDAAEGAILAHSLKLAKGRLRKGKVLGAEDLEALKDAGYDKVIVARLEPGDIGEDEAAKRLASALVPDPIGAGLTITAPFTGRVNLIADGPGIVDLDPQTLSEINNLDPMITVATVPQYQQMGPGGMVATIKIIAYGVAEAAISRAETLARTKPTMQLVSPAYQNVGLVMSVIPGGPDNGKGQAAIRGRVEALGMRLEHVVEVPHTEAALTEALRGMSQDVLLILTSSATSDPCDVAPQAVRAAGGVVERFGMPVDPGNLLFLGQLDHRPVIGLPGCARSPALNGADWVLSRVACGMSPTQADISAMGVGGLLKEIPTRPQPRASRVK